MTTAKLTGIALSMVAVAAFAISGLRADTAARSKAISYFGRLPLQFEQNRGQAESRVKFLARGGGYTLLLGSDGAAISSHRKPALRMTLVGGNERAPLVGVERLPGKVNYMMGNDSAKWRTGIPTYARVEYEQVYPGIDLIYYGNQGQLEYDFVLAPGADPSKIRLRLDGATPRLDERGDLVLTARVTPSPEKVSFRKPVIYQLKGTEKEIVPGRFVLAGNHEVHFEVARYDRSRPLVIDPVLLYASYLGGTQENVISGVAVNGDGEMYVTGYSSAASTFTTTPGALQPTKPVCRPGDCDPNPTTDAFVSKISADGTSTPPISAATMKTRDAPSRLTPTATRTSPGIPTRTTFPSPPMPFRSYAARRAFSVL